MKIKTKFLVLLLIGALVFSWILTASAQAPGLSLKDSLKMAEEALAKAAVDTSHHYLYSITLSRDNQGSYWYYTYRPVTPNEFKEIFVRVYMDGSTKITNSNSSLYQP